MGTRSEKWRRTSRITFFELNQNGGEGGIGNNLTPLWQCHGQNVKFCYAE